MPGSACRSGASGAMRGMNARTCWHTACRSAQEETSACVQNVCWSAFPLNSDPSPAREAPSARADQTCVQFCTVAHACAGAARACLSACAPKHMRMCVI
eukprot:4025480-Pleurochrysis_carterae.AAC.3